MKIKRSPGSLDLSTQRLASKEPFQAFVVAVPDGDTLQVSRSIGVVTRESIEFIRLAGIDAPEFRGLDARGAMAAQHALSELVLGQVVTVRPRRVWRDPYHRIIASVTFNGEDVGAWLIFRGVAKPRCETKPIQTP